MQNENPPQRIDLIQPEPKGNDRYRVTSSASEPERNPQLDVINQDRRREVEDIRARTGIRLPANTAGQDAPESGLSFNGKRLRLTIPLGRE